MARIVSICLVFACSSIQVRDAAAQQSGSIVVTVTTQDGSVLLPGATIALSPAADGVQPAPETTPVTEVTDGQGHARFDSIAPGFYVAVASLAGFDEARADAVVEPGRDTTVRLDLRVSPVAEHVDVVGAAETTRPTIATTLGPKGVLDHRTVAELPVHDNSVMSALKLIGGIVDRPSGVRIKGGRP